MKHTRGKQNTNTHSVRETFWSQRDDLGELNVNRTMLLKWTL
jgi:hypothetical protein